MRNKLFRFNYELKRVPQLTKSQTEVTTHSRMWRGHAVFGSREEVLKMSGTTSNWNLSVMALRHFWCCFLLLPCEFSVQSWSGLPHEHSALWVWNDRQCKLMLPETQWRQLQAVNFRGVLFVCLLNFCLFFKRTHSFLLFLKLNDFIIESKDFVDTVLSIKYLMLKLRFQLYNYISGFNYIIIFCCCHLFGFLPWY